MNTNNINNVLGILAGLAAGAIIIGAAGLFLYGINNVIMAVVG